MIDSKYKWQLDQPADSSVVDKLAKDANIDPFMAKTLIQRGITSADAVEDFLNPSVSAFHDPFLMHDMHKGIERIQQAVENGEHITVYGDYDADGITSTTVMYETLSDLGADVDYYIPNRFTEGYGPNVEAFQKIIQKGTSLIVTVDNGVAGNQAIVAANELHCDVVVTDHHSLPEKLPDAYAIIHPRVKNENGDAYPFGDLCGAGVAFKVAQALMDEVPSDLIDITAIGTVADVVSLRDENRAIVKFGVQAISNSQRPGLLALIKEAGIDLGRFSEEDIGFGIAPRLNSLGRIKDATVGVELLSTFDEDRAGELAKFANQQNDLRKSLVDQFFTEAVQSVEDSGDISQRHTLVVVGHNWHQGVLGIVASRLVDKYQRPTIVMTDTDGSEEVKGSGRSVDNFDLFKAIDPIRDQTIGFGGHHSAVGLTIKKDKVPVLKDQLEKAAEEQQLDLSVKPKLAIAGVIPVSQVTAVLCDKIKTLAPFGQDNPKPIFQVQFDQLANVKAMGKTSDHLKFSLVQGNNRLTAIAFGRGSAAVELQNSQAAVQVVGEIGENTWNNRTTLQLMVDDLKQTLPPVIDERTHELHRKMFATVGTYVFFHEKVLKQLQGYVGGQSQVVMYDQVTEASANGNRLYIVDCPDVLDDLVQLLAKVQPQTTVLYLYKKQLISKIGMPDRNSYAKLFRFVKEHSNVNIAMQLKQISEHLHISARTIIFMVQVFLELDFITIQDRVINLNPNYTARDLKTAPSYHLRVEQLAAEKKLLVSNTHELVSFVKDCLGV
ncbi:single-stranded-DNA-specific exonuclease RecJ [Lentilactobacillus buchneri]|uniref:Single-stranded-DNA-specific exonuclease RecJ n=1 Tax=Lentilactobacillus buchneri subsp. silagei CD034 TaxID=1071400 RepID=J9W2L1_LENBU|nr:single-stranded-DNA-specific exonuclease RecJ [Lentilactobacillus buchneri]MCC6101988.1 single-stranded-DNA-specific exonuclease RecJ [Lactobacillus sp.]AFR99886.1 single-stranded-DNA-specific exonuclease [Lentilactobacillus buchneri subsp. silagei CD034]MCT2901616.1 single-stranded-DNA-specific exonuclease RecJ [Lentilactobacillus buchneri]MCT3543407.1 single-stranded-DNA-specific exonuclease RecJ [Lentilactobacillus buchneri]MCT3543973.1 single-stranded-DNA-specific exonuclease RecJ [Lent